MFKVGEYLIYNKIVCRINEIRNDKGNEGEYYLLVPISNDSLKIEVPVTNLWHNLRPLITKEEVNNLISSIPNIDLISSDNRSIEKDYKLLLNSGKPEDLIKIIKTNYFKNKEKTDIKKNAVIKDSNFCSLAEKYLYEEFSAVLGITYDETKELVLEAITK